MSMKVDTPQIAGLNNTKSDVGKLDKNVKAGEAILSKSQTEMVRNADKNKDGITTQQEMDAYAKEQNIGKKVADNAFETFAQFTRASATRNQSNEIVVTQKGQYGKTITTTFKDDNTTSTIVTKQDGSTIETIKDKDGNELKAIIKYPDGRLNMEIDSQNGSETIYAYDKNNNLSSTWQNFENGYRIMKRPDGTPIREITPESNGNKRTTAYSRDDKGNLTSSFILEDKTGKTINSGNTKPIYDEAGNLTGFHTTQGSKKSTSIKNERYTDTQGNITKLVQTDSKTGQVTTIDYSNGKPVSAIIKNSDNSSTKLKFGDITTDIKFGNIDSILNNSENITTTIFQNANGQVTQINYQDGSSITNDYDSASGSLLTKTKNDPNGNIEKTDANGNTIYKKTIGTAKTTSSGVTIQSTTETDYTTGTTTVTTKDTETGKVLTLMTLGTDKSGRTYQSVQDANGIITTDFKDKNGNIVETAMGSIEDYL